MREPLVEIRLFAKDHVNRHFALSCHIVQNKSCWNANNAVGPSKQRKVGLEWYEFLYFVTHTCTVLFASQYNILDTMWPDRAKGLLNNWCQGNTCKTLVNMTFRTKQCNYQLQIDHFWHSRLWTSTSLQLSVMRRIFANEWASTASLVVPVPFRKCKSGPLLQIVWSVWRLFWNFISFFFSIKTKFLTLNLLFKRKIGKNCDSQPEPINCTFILSKSKPILIIFVTGSPDALFVELGPNMYVKLLASN